MGGSSSTTRRVVVEDCEGAGVVKISESVVKRIRGQEGQYTSISAETEDERPRYPPPPPRSPFVPPPAGADDLEEYYMARLKQLEDRNAELQKITNEQFIKAVQEVEQKFLKQTCSPVCQDLQSRVYDCYLANPKQTLNCSAQVRAFSNCVERARQNALLRKG